MNEEKDIKDFMEKGDLLQAMEKYRLQQPITDMMLKVNERSAIYLEFMASAFLQETGLKASEVELITYINFDEIHWRFVKKE